MKETTMVPRMTTEETALYVSFVRNSRDYVEFGAGGSTVIASRFVTNSILSIDSAQGWLDQVGIACASSPTIPQLEFIDIGPTGDWGHPIDPSTKSRWPEYHSAIWRFPQSSNADLYLIDGRFRVACFAQIALRCKSTAIIGIHDFGSRAAYHCIREIGHEIATAGDLSFFLSIPKKDTAETLLRSYSVVPD
jgi:hypothetical protein